MPNEELIQRAYLAKGELRGDPFGLFESFNLGSTTIAELHKIGLIERIPEKISFPFKYYKPPKHPKQSKPDTVYAKRIGGTLNVFAVKEYKQPNQFDTAKLKSAACEQALFCGYAISATIAVATDGKNYIYIDISKSLKQQMIVCISEHRELTPAVLQEVLQGKPGQFTDPSVLAERAWQAIWHATKEEPKQCLMTFVEIFVLKFLSDNLPKTVLPATLTFYELIDNDAQTFFQKYGKTRIQYYVEDIRPQIKKIFPDKTVVANPDLLNLFGIKTLVSESSIINGFAFLRSGETSISTFDRTFIEILGYFQDFGPLTNIDPEFKLRLYETFLKKTANKQQLGQFFTPRNIVKSMITMAQLCNLSPGSVVLDPASGVGGFVLEPLLQKDGLPNNIQFKNGKPVQKITLVGIDVDTNTHILAKANTLIHVAEALRDPAVTVTALNRLATELFLNIKTNQHLGTLEYSIKEAVDVIITNPPYVTKGSGIYKQEIENISGLRNKIDLRDYYNRCGLGLEALFLRYISGALKPGGRAFVIVPQGLLTRTDSTLKEKLLSECNLIASISLPQNAFFSTAQKTYIIAFEKRHVASEDRPPVFCGIATSIGESLDARRISTPNDNTLAVIAKEFVQYSETRNHKDSKHVRVISYDEFSPKDRWDVKRFWTDDELVELGARDEAIGRTQFAAEAESALLDVVKDLAELKKEIAQFEEVKKKVVLLTDTAIFKIRRGTRVTRADGDKNPGPIPVYSGSKDPRRPLCTVSENWAQKNKIHIEDKPIITVNANGFVGAVFVRRERCIIHDDVMIIEVLDTSIDLDFLCQQLRASIAEGNFEYEAKLYSRVKELSVEIPFVKSKFDLMHQRKIAGVLKEFDNLRETISDIGQWAAKSRIKDK
jgi:type I restriction enzyme M protein